MKKIRISDLELLRVGHEIQLAGGLWASEDTLYLCIFPDEDRTEEKEICLLQMGTEDWEKFLRQTDILETEILLQGPQGITKAVVRKSQRQIDQNLAWEVFQRDNYTCRYCGRTGIPLSVDHIDLWEEGGATVRENLLTACKPCNRVRGKMPYEEWIKSLLYERRSQDLTNDTKGLNLEIVDRLPHLKSLRVQNIRSR